MRRWYHKLLKVEPGEGSLVTFVLSIMFFVALGNTVGSNSIDGLLFAKLGTDWLPLLYILAGLTTATVLSLNIVLLSRFPHVRLFSWLPVILALVLILARLSLLLDLTFLLPFLWLLKEVLYFVQMSFTWGVANLNTYPRQAKRIFPLFTAGNILGTIIGGFLTTPLINWLSIDNMVLLWALLLLLSAIVARRLLRQKARSTACESQRTKERNIFDDLLLGFHHVKASTLLCWISIASIVLIICGNSLYLVFSKVATAHYVTPAKLASFLGLIQASSTTVALLLSLFFTNRFFARYGTMTAFLVYPALFAIGFGLYGLWPTFFILTAFRFVQLAWSGGVTSAIWPTVFNIVPPERREVVSTFNRGVSAQLGAILAGLFLMAAKRYLAIEHVAIAGMAAGLVGFWVLWRAKQAYGEALTDLLHHGNPEVFFKEEEPFGGFSCNKEALDALLAGAKDKRPALRRVTMEILGYVPGEETRKALIEGLDDARPFVRAAAIEALRRREDLPWRTPWSSSPQQLVESLSKALQDKEPEVVKEALLFLAKSAAVADQRSSHPFEEQLKILTNNKNKEMAFLALALLQDKGLKIHLASKDSNERTLALWALQWAPQKELLNSILSATHAKEPQVRAAAARALGTHVGGQVGAQVGTHVCTHIGAHIGEHNGAHIGVHMDAHKDAETDAQTDMETDTQNTEHLNKMLEDKHVSVRLAAAETLANKGLPLTPNLKHPERIDATLFGLTLRTSQNSDDVFVYENTVSDTTASESATSVTTTSVTTASEAITAFVDSAQQEALRYYEAAKQCPLHNRSHRILAVSLLCKSRHWALRCLRAIFVKLRERVVQVALENLDNKDLCQRGSALEALETSSASTTIRPLLPLFENKWHFSKEQNLDVTKLLTDEDDWIRACAAWVCPKGHNEHLSKMEKEDPSPFVRRVAIEKLEKEENMETLSTLSLMEQIAFLRKMTLFSSLPPADLRDIAAQMSEELFPADTHLAHQGESGEELYLIISGTVRVYTKTNDGQELTLATCGCGQVVGDMALLSGERRMASLVTESDVRALVLGRKAFSRMVRDKPDIGLAVIEVLCQRLRSSQETAEGSESSGNVRRGEGSDEEGNGSRKTDEVATEMTWASFF